METTWSDRIIALEARGWTLKAIAERMYLSPQAVSDIKRGSSKAPTGMAAVRLYQLYAQEVGVKPEEAIADKAAGGNDTLGGTDSASDLCDKAA